MWLWCPILVSSNFNGCYAQMFVWPSVSAAGLQIINTTIKPTLSKSPQPIKGAPNNILNYVNAMLVYKWMNKYLHISVKVLLIESDPLHQSSLSSHTRLIGKSQEESVNESINKWMSWGHRLIAQSERLEWNWRYNLKNYSHCITFAN